MQSALDLFGDVVITEADIFNWVAAVAPHFLSTPESYSRYVRNWNVAGKVRAAKLNGTFDETISTKRRPWHARLALYAIV